MIRALAAVIAAAAEGRLGQVPAAVAVALVAMVAARAGLAQVVEVSGRRTATRVMSALRAELVGRRLRPGAGRAGRGDSAELAAAAVQGVDGLETYFARYLPQVVLAVVVPVAVLCWCAAVDLTSALVMAVTLPVIPVFMVLIGRAAGARARANFQALAGLSSWFLDVVRGLPTLRAFNRGTAQVDAIREVTEELGIESAVGRLLVVDWMPPYLGWDDAIEMIFDGGLVGEDDLARARQGRIGIVLQAFHLLPTMTALENVAVPLELAGPDGRFWPALLTTLVWTAATPERPCMMPIIRPSAARRTPPATRSPSTTSSNSRTS